MHIIKLTNDRPEIEQHALTEPAAEAAELAAALLPAAAAAAAAADYITPARVRL